MHPCLCTGPRASASALTPPLPTPGQNIRKLVKDGFVIKKPEKVHSRARTNAWAEAKRKVGRCQLRHPSSSCELQITEDAALALDTQQPRGAAPIGMVEGSCG